jgi:hypothetical protein
VIHPKALRRIRGAHRGRDGVWAAAAPRAVGALGLELVVHEIRPDGEVMLDADGWFEDIFEISQSGVIVVRSDGHVGFRGDDVSDGAAEVLRGALTEILAVPTLITTP